eukprot:TRINITY_DN2138_c0_g1_i1.p1 TRINITY_DN2138_c0_g1~~TRINITY_DN2138_c0_g1_i1.p1  ORF type:complete len:133 (+),score=8.85 TRINITY_DN2138_c0_g1_i1:50-448(+)
MSESPFFSFYENDGRFKLITQLRITRKRVKEKGGNGMCRMVFNAILLETAMRFFFLSFFLLYFTFLLFGCGRGTGWVPEKPKKESVMFYSFQCVIHLYEVLSFSLSFFLFVFFFFSFWVKERRNVGKKEQEE